ncbi:hypothetical protein [Streptomyces zhihengii]
MSAAEAAMTTPADDEPHSRGTVFHLSDHPAAQRGTARTSAPPGNQPPTPEQALAEHMESLMHAAGRTLTDGPTAEVYGITLGAVAVMLEGAHGEGLIDQTQFEHLHGMIDGMRNAPHLL